MEIKIKVIAESSTNKVKQEKGNLTVYVKAKKRNLEANRAVLAILAKHFGVAENKIKIIRGKTSKNKIVEII